MSDISSLLERNKKLATKYLVCFSHSHLCDP